MQLPHDLPVKTKVSEEIRMEIVGAVAEWQPISHPKRHLHRRGSSWNMGEVDVAMGQRAKFSMNSRNTDLNVSYLRGVGRMRPPAPQNRVAASQNPTAEGFVFIALTLNGLGRCRASRARD